MFVEGEKSRQPSVNNLPESQKLDEKQKLLILEAVKLGIQGKLTCFLGTGNAKLIVNLKYFCNTNRNTHTYLLVSDIRIGHIRHIDTL